MIQDYVSRHLSDADKIFYLREAVQNRLQLDFTITDDEATALLHTYPASVLLQALRMVKKHLEKRREDFVIYTQDEVVEVIKFFAGITHNRLHDTKDVHFIEPEFMRSMPKFS